MIEHELMVRIEKENLVFLRLKVTEGRTHTREHFLHNLVVRWGLMNKKNHTYKNKKKPLML